MNELEKIIQEYTEKTARRVQNEVIIVGEAKEVTDNTCEVHRNGYAPKLGVTLRSIERMTDTYYTIVPKEGSMVIAAEIEKNPTECVLIACSEIEKIIVKAGEQTTHLFTDNQVNWIVNDMSVELKPEAVIIKSSDMELKVKDGEILFNGGANGGLIKIQDLVDNLNEVKDYLSDFKDAVSAGFVAVGAGTSANGTTGKTKFEDELVGKSIDYVDMENDKVKH